MKKNDSFSNGADSDNLNDLKKQNNFKAAMSQIINGTKPDAEKDSSTIDKIADLTEQIKMHEQATNNPFSSNKYAPDSNTPSGPKSKTIIASDFEINGDVKANGDIEINGMINGNVSTQGHIQLAGIINGSVAAESANLSSGKITGENVVIQTDVTLGREFELAAQISAKNIEIDGRVKGNITVSESVILHANAKVAGDVTASDLTMEKGAALSGNMKISEI